MMEAHLAPLLQAKLDEQLRRTMIAAVDQPVANQPSWRDKLDAIFKGVIPRYSIFVVNPQVMASFRNKPTPKSFFDIPLHEKPGQRHPCYAFTDVTTARRYLNDELTEDELTSLSSSSLPTSDLRPLASES